MLKDGNLGMNWNFGGVFQDTTAVVVMEALLQCLTEKNERKFRIFSPEKRGAK